MKLLALGQDLGLDEGSLKEWLQTQLGNAQEDLVSVQDWKSEMVREKWESQEQVARLFGYRTKAEAEIRKLEEMLELLRATSREKISLEMSRGKAPEKEQGVVHKETLTERDAAVPKSRKLEEDGVHTGGGGPENQNPTA